MACLFLEESWRLVVIFSVVGGQWSVKQWGSVGGRLLEKAGMSLWKMKVISDR
jgi:hypothetical protein